MADLSALEKAIIPMQGNDDASRLVAALLRAHYPQELARLPAVKVRTLPAVFDPAGVQVDGLYDFADRSAHIRQVPNPTYRYPVNGQAPVQQLTTEDVLKLFESATHELQHAGSHQRRGDVKRLHAQDPGIFQTALSQGVSKDKLLDAATDIVTGKNMESAQASSNPEVVLEEFMAYAVPARKNKERASINTASNNNVLAQTEKILSAHPWMESLMNEWTKPANQAGDASGVPRSGPQGAKR